MSASGRERSSDRAAGISSASMPGRGAPGASKGPRGPVAVVPAPPPRPRWPAGRPARSHAPPARCGSGARPCPGTARRPRPPPSSRGRGSPLRRSLSATPASHFDRLPCRVASRSARSTHSDAPSPPCPADARGDRAAGGARAPLRCERSEECERSHLRTGPAVPRRTAFFASFASFASFARSPRQGGVEAGQAAQRRRSRSRPDARRSGQASSAKSARGRLLSPTYLGQASADRLRTHAGEASLIAGPRSAPAGRRLYGAAHQPAPTSGQPPSASGRKACSAGIVATRS